MRALTAADPAAIGGHRLLGRLGSGGMGTVYLGRSPAGNLVAVKVIRADHAADPAFRARFRREATAAGRLTGRWVVPVVAADPEAREPWLATPFVPGPSLAEAVAAYGPLPAGTVRTLGVRLAEALEQVHSAGLVHRDVKPGNILLALDGPRLIDFGIARETGSTALTSADAVVGTPGYLAPELARAGAPAPEPASDLFSLGCVLAYAATGRGPFGGGHPAAVVFRTIHEEPELDEVPEELRPAIASCTAKDPASRPTPAELRVLLGGSGEAVEPADAAPDVADRVQPVSGELHALPGAPGTAGSVADSEDTTGAADAVPEPEPERGSAALGGPAAPTVGPTAAPTVGPGPGPVAGPRPAPVRPAPPAADAPTAGRPAPPVPVAPDPGAGQAPPPAAAHTPTAPNAPGPSAAPPRAVPDTVEDAADAAGPAYGTAGDWLPPGLRRLITERSTRALDLPAPEVTRADGIPGAAVEGVEGVPGGEAPRTALSRRRLFAFGGAALAVAAVPAVLLRGGGGAGGEAGAGQGSTGTRDLPVFALGLQADLTGPGKATGQAHERGARLAVEDHNARPDALFRFVLKVADDAGDAARAERVARELAADPAVTAVLGPTWDAALGTVAGVCAAADLALLPVSVDSPENAASTWQTLCLTRPADVQISFPIIHYLSQVRPSPRTAVVEDEAGGRTAWRISQFMQQAPPARGTVTVHRVPAAGSGSDIGAAAAALTAAGADAAVLTSNSPERAVRFARALADAGFRGPRVGIQQVMEPGFLADAGRAAEGWVFGALFTDPLAVPAAARFTAAHRKAYGAPPARWATEAYDAVGLVATALAALTEGGRDRSGLSRRIFRTPYRGLAKTLEHDPTSRSLIDGRLGHLYKVTSGAYRYLGIYADVRTDS
ncbi:bifunctional serine/threonine-protein kinase/ABC transporter substrate-binding protein [Streptomyces sp. NPDC089799]|uniref:bifunctional serine/threonine-protein kinase/ABC transporter substrate-binding protein n=1 Tax=Streptomyces sp. NPDC089799 TaxID=3155066 RepID=UPI0034334BE3